MKDRPSTGSGRRRRTGTSLLSRWGTRRARYAWRHLQADQVSCSQRVRSGTRRRFSSARARAAGAPVYTDPMIPRRRQADPRETRQVVDINLARQRRRRERGRRGISIAPRRIRGGAAASRQTGGRTRWSSWRASEQRGRRCARRGRRGAGGHVDVVVLWGPGEEALRRRSSRQLAAPQCSRRRRASPTSWRWRAARR